MDLEITHIRFPAHSEHTHPAIIAYRWKRGDTGETGETDKPTMVQWLDKPGNSAHVGSGAQRVSVGVWNEAGKQPWLQTYADGKWNNNLLSLPTF